MCGKGSGANTVVQSSSPPPQVMQAYQTAVNNAQTVSQNPYQFYPGQLVANLTPDESQAIGNIANLGGTFANTAAGAVGSGYNAGAGLLNEASQGVNGAYGIANPFINAASGAVGSAIQPISSNAITNYMNPYQGQVVGSTLAEIQQNNAIQQAQLQGSAASQGALGGDRAALAAATLANQQNLATNQTIAGLNAQNYSQALAAAQQDAARQLQGGFLYGNLGETAMNAALAPAGAQSQLASTASALGTNAAQGYGAAQNLALQQAGSQLTAGELEQQQAQNILNAGYGQWQAGMQYPFQATQYYANIAEGLGSLMGGTGSTTYPSPSMLSQALGAGVAGVGLAGELGLIGGGTSGIGAAGTALGALGAGFLRRGGRIPHLAPGGGISLPYQGAPQGVSYVPAGTLATIGKGPPQPPSMSPAMMPKEPSIGTLAGIVSDLKGNKKSDDSDNGPNWAGIASIGSGITNNGYAEGGFTVPRTAEDVIGDEQMLWSLMSPPQTQHPPALASGGATTAPAALGGQTTASASQVPANIPLVSTAIETPAGMPSRPLTLGEIPQVPISGASAAAPSMATIAVPQVNEPQGTRTGALFGNNPSDSLTFQNYVKGFPINQLPVSNSGQVTAASPTPPAYVYDPSIYASYNPAMRRGGGVRGYDAGGDVTPADPDNPDASLTVQEAPLPPPAPAQTLGDLAQNAQPTTVPADPTMGARNAALPDLPAVNRAISMAGQPIGQLPVPETTQTEKTAESPWSMLMTIGAGMLSGTSPFAGVNIGRGLMAGQEYMQNMLPQERARQALQLSAQKQNIANILAQREQALAGGEEALRGRAQGLEYLKTLPTVQGAAITANTLPGVPGVPGVPSGPSAATPAGAAPTAAPAGLPPNAAGAAPQGENAAPLLPPFLNLPAQTYSDRLSSLSKLAVAPGTIGAAAQQELTRMQSYAESGKMPTAGGGIANTPGALTTQSQQAVTTEQSRDVSAEIAKLQQNWQGALTSQQTLLEMADAAKKATPNYYGEFDANMARRVIGGLHQLGIPASDNLKDYASNADMLHKLNVQVASQAVRLTGDRAYQAVLLQAGATPSVGMSSPESFAALTRALGQGAQLNIDLANYTPQIEAWQAAHPTDQWGWRQQFAASHPPAMYASRISPINVPVANGKVGKVSWHPGFDYSINGRIYQFDGSNLVPTDDLGNAAR